MTTSTQKPGLEVSEGRWVFSESERKAINEACLGMIDAWKAENRPWDWADLLVELNSIVIREIRGRLK